MKPIYILLLSLTIPSFSDVKIYPETTVNGIEFSVTKGTSLSTCLVFCENSSQCVAINFRIKEKRCSLMKSMSGQMKFEKITSGIKYSWYKRPPIKKIVVTDKVKQPEKRIAINKPVKKDFTFVNDASLAITNFFSRTSNSIKETFSKKETPRKKYIKKEKYVKKIEDKTINEEVISLEKNDIILEDGQSKIKDSIVKRFSETPIKKIYSCQLYERNNRELLVDRKCEIKKYLFDDHTRLSIGFLNGHRFLFRQYLNGVVYYINDKGQKEKAYFDNNDIKGEVIFDKYRIKYSSIK